MKLSIDLGEELGQALEVLARETEKNPDVIMREALSAWLEQTTERKWPSEVVSWQGTEDTVDFEVYRNELSIPPEPVL